MPKNVLIVGMPRSGTSMTASIFSRYNYFVAENKDNELRSADEFNPSGYWEVKPLIQANVEILKSAGFNHDNTWLFDPITDKQSENILKLDPSSKHKQLVDKFDSQQPWMWKDPRLCYTLGYWWPLLNPQTTRVLLLKRSKLEIFKSFLRLNWRSNTDKDKKDVNRRIEHHLKSAENAIKFYNIPFIEIQYSDYKNKPNEIAKKLSDFFEINITRKDLGYKHKLNNNSLHGSLLKLTSKLSKILPKNIKQQLKKLTPSFLLKIINPNKYS